MGGCASKAPNVRPSEKLGEKAASGAVDAGVAALLGLCGAPIPGFVGPLLGQYAAHVYRERKGIPHPPSEDELIAMKIEALIKAKDMQRLRIIASGGAKALHLRHPNTGAAAIHVAAQHCADAIPVLLRAGARVDSPVRVTKRTPLMLAAMSRNTASVRVLLSWGARVGYTDAVSGRTALHLAAVADAAECVSLLLQAGADPSALDDKYQTAADVAAAGNCLSCLAILLPSASGDSAAQPATPLA